MLLAANIILTSVVVGAKVPIPGQRPCVALMQLGLGNRLIYSRF